MPAMHKEATQRILPPLAMHNRYGLLMRAFFARYFKPLQFPPNALERIRQLAQEGVVVYIARSANILHYLYLNYILEQNQLPLARFVNEVDPLLLQPVGLLLERMRTLGDESRADMEEDSAHLLKRQLASTLGSGQAALLFLDRPSTITSPQGANNTDLLQTLVQVQLEQDKPIFLVPNLIIWNRHPEREDRGIADAVFGVPEKPGFLRSMFLLWQRHRKAFVKVAEPINLKEFIQARLDQSPETLSNSLQDALETYLSQEVFDVTGPRIRPQSEFIRGILSDPKIEQAIVSESLQEPGRVEALRKRAHDLLDEIAAVPRIRWTLSLDAILNIFWTKMYEGIVVDKSGFEKIRAAIRKSPVVFCPSHKSHVDYLVLSQLCLRQGVPLPHIAAGVNLSFWPMGPIFRHSGAFFMRRSFKGDSLYPAVFRTYLRHIMKEGFPIEFFIEGTRSRTGKRLSPKFGILSWLVQASQEGSGNDLQFVPISIDYEKIVESQSYVKELTGGEKEKENVSSLVKSGKVLRSKYGKVYVQVADPISLRDYMRERKLDETRLSEDERKQLISDLGHEILAKVNEVATVTPSAVLAFCLLNHRQRGMTQGKMLERAKWTVAWIRRRNDVRFSHAFGDFGRAMAESAARFSRDGLVSIQDTGFELVYAAVERRRLALDYYRNNIIQHFAPASIAAAALESFTVEAVPRAALEDRIRDLSSLFRFEFLFRSELHFQEEVTKSLSDLMQEGVIRMENDFVIKVAGIEDLRSLFRAVLEHFLETYWLTAKSLKFLIDSPLPEKEFLNRSLNLGDHLFVQGELLLPESLSKDVIKNALLYFIARGVLKNETAEGRRGSMLTLNDSWKSESALASLDEEIRKYLRR